jgi:hypothetical protein
MFLPSSTSEDGYIKFSASSADPMDEVLSDLVKGLTFDVTLRTDGISPAPTYKYRIKVNKAGSVDVKDIAKL